MKKIWSIIKIPIYLILIICGIAGLFHLMPQEEFEAKMEDLKLLGAMMVWFLLIFGGYYIISKIFRRRNKH